MKFKSRTIIEITDNAIKLFQASLTANHALTFGGMVSCENMSDEAIVQRLVELRKSKGVNLRNSDIVLIIPRQYAILRYLDLPSDSPQELARMVDLQAVSQLPYAKEEIVVDFLPLHKSSEGYTKVLLAVVPLDTVTRFAKILEAAQLPPNKVTASFIGQWLWYTKHYPGQTGVTVLLDVDSSRTEICICDSSKVLLSRPTTLGIKELDAKQYEEFLKQLDWTMASYVKEQLGPPISQIFLLSSMSSVEELKEQMQRHYTIPVTSIKTLQNVAVKKSFAWPPLLLKEWPAITAMLGFLQTTQGGIIDLIPSEVKMARAARAGKRQSVRLGVVAVIASVSIALCFSLNFFRQNSRLSYLEGQIKDAQKEVAAVKLKKQQLNALKSLIDNRIVLVDIIGEIYNALPEQVVLTNIALTPEHILSLQGYTAKVSDVNDMQRYFIGSAYFDSVNLDYVNKRITLSGEVNYFKITCHIKTKGSSDEET